MTVIASPVAARAAQLAQATPSLKRRRRAWVDLMLRDHGFLREAFHNFHWIGPGMARANQPSPGRLVRYARMGFTTVLNLRGQSDRGFYLLEQETCSAVGLRLIDVACSATEAPGKAMILAIPELFKTLDGRCLMHCKSGSDRTGLMAVLYSHLQLGQPMDQALRQLSLQYLHLSSGKAGMVDFFFQEYLRAQSRSGKSLLSWVEEDYDPDILAQAFRRRARRPH